jgi:hypothetical protein
MNLAEIDCGSNGTVFRLRALASGAELNKSNEVNAAVRRIRNAVIFVRDMMKPPVGLFFQTECKDVIEFYYPIPKRFVEKIWSS